jgi:hypothetical protein
MVFPHGQSIDLARRLSSRNEPDFLQESMFDDPSETDATEVYTQDFCMDLAKRVKKAALPVSCLKHLDAPPSASLQRQDSRHDNAIAFEGMSAGEKESAMSSRDRGMAHQAKLQRRMTGGLTGRYNRG